jgi:hypothetical protein
MTEIDEKKTTYKVAKIPERLVANPHHYNNIHSMLFSDDGTVNMFNGGRDSINLVVSGKSKFVFNRNASGKLYIKLDDHNPIKVNLKIEKGPFYLNNEVICNWDNIIHVAEEKYVFNTDPLKLCRESKKNNLTSTINYKDDLEKRTYYHSVDTKTVTEFDDEDIDFTKNGFFKVLFSKFNCINKYNENIYEDLVKNCDYVDQMVEKSADEIFEDEDDDYNTRYVFEGIAKRLGMNHESKILADKPTEVVAYYDKDIEILGYYILETINYFNDVANISFNVACIHALEVLPGLENYETILDDIIYNIGNAINNRCTYLGTTALILPDIYSDLVSKFKEINFERDENLQKTHKSKIKLMYEELVDLEFYEFDLESDIILYNTSPKSSEKVNE